MPRKTRSRKEKRSEGGKRKGTRKASSWAMAVKKVYADMKRKNPETTTLGDAMRKASKMRKAGEL
jgi:hypothetical protein